MGAVPIVKQRFFGGLREFYAGKELGILMLSPLGSRWDDWSRQVIGRDLEQGSGESGEQRPRLETSPREEYYFSLTHVLVHLLMY